MNIERTTQGYRISTVHAGYRISQHYIGYTRREAIQLFRAHLRLEVRA